MTNTSDEDSVFNDNLSVFSDGHESTHSLGGLHEEHGKDLFRKIKRTHATDGL